MRARKIIRLAGTSRARALMYWSVCMCDVSLNTHMQRIWSYRWGYSSSRKPQLSRFNLATGTVLLESLYTLVESISFMAMWNTMECKRDSFNGSLSGTSETHWECVSHCLMSNSAVNLNLLFSFLGTLEKTEEIFSMVSRSSAIIRMDTSSC